MAKSIADLEHIVIRAGDIAPIIIKNIIPVTLTELKIAVVMLVLLTCFLIKAMKNAAKAPIPAASVAVKIPEYIPPKTRRHSSMTDHKSFRETIRSRQVAGSPGGARSVRRLARA